MSVNLISFEYFPVQHGGLSRYASEIINRLVKCKNYKAIIAIPAGYKKKFHPNIVTLKIRTYSIKYLSYIEFSIKVLFKYVLSRKKNSYILFSTFSYLFMPIFPREYYLFVTNTLKRVYITDYPHESFSERIIRKLTYFVLFKYENYIANKAEKVFAISPSTLVDVNKQYKIPKNKLELIPCALNTNIFLKASHPKRQFNYQLLSVSRFVPRKNIIDLIMMMSKLSQLDNRYVLNLVGGGPKKHVEKIKRKIQEYNLKSQVILHQNISDAKLNELYKNSSVFLFSSLVEGFGLVVLEAMSKGLPVIAYDVGGVRDIIIDKKNGFIITPFDHNKFINSINSLSKNKKVYANFSKQALLRVNDFSWEKSVRRMRDLIE